MSGETDDRTVDLEYLVRLLDEADRRYEQRFAAQERATVADHVAHAETVTEIREGIRLRFDDLESKIQEKRDHLTSLLAAHAARDDERYAALTTAIAASEAAVTAATSHRLDEIRRASDLALANQKEAVGKVEVANEKRFESVNEFRGTLSDLTRTLMPRLEVQALIAANSEKIESLVTRMDKSDGRGDGGLATRNAIYATIATVIAVIGIILAIYSNTRHGA